MYQNHPKSYATKIRTSTISEINLLGGWPTPLKNDGVKVSWDDEIPNIFTMEKSSSHVPKHQKRSPVPISGRRDAEQHSGSENHGGMQGQPGH